MLRLDDLQVNGLKLYQDTDTFCFGCDAVELANFVGAGRGEVAELGAGNGIISVLLAGKFSRKVTAVEIQPRLAELIEKNVQYNNLQDKISVVNMSMQDFAKENRAKSFDVVVVNPPYRKVGSGERQEKSEIEIARHEVLVTLAEVVESGARLLSSGGKFYIIHMCERLAEVIYECVSRKLEPKVLQILTPNETKMPHLFMLQCAYGGAVGLSVAKPRIVGAF